MNIFYLHKDPHVSAQAMTNKHVVKMVVETAQLLSTAHNELDGMKENIYKTTHKNHPSAVWVRQSKKHYDWAYSHFLALSLEYSNRYKKVHKTYRDLFEPLRHHPKNLKGNQFTDPPQCMPDQYKDFSTVEAYRRYYLNEKIKNDDDLKRFINKIKKENKQ
jgi:hypothetical protein